MRRLLQSAALLAAGLLWGCGGGGGSNGFSLSETPVSFSAFEGEALPYRKSISVRVNDPDVAYLGAGYRDGVVPEWLAVTIAGNAPDFRVNLDVTSTSLVPGNYQTTLTVGTANASGDILDTRDVTVTYKLDSRVTFIESAAEAIFVYGAATTTQSLGFPVRARQQRWSASSDRDWLIVPAESYQGSTSLPVTVDVSGLAPGRYKASITLTSPDSPETNDTAEVTATVQEPTLIAPDQIVLGGDDGRDHSPVPFQFSINTGALAHGWTLELTTASGGNWLRASDTNGMVSGTPATVQLRALADIMRGGVYRGTAKLAVDVAGITLTRDIDVTFNKEAERLYVMSEGVALTHLPSRQLLSRDISVATTLDRLGVPWQASSDTGWLSVTAAGVTGGHVTLTADPSGLAPMQTHFANVTLTTDDPAIENSQRIRVGLWVGETDPSDFVLPVDAAFVAANPVQPLVYTYGTSDPFIEVFNIHTGAHTLRINSPRNATAAMAVSGDGTKLYVAATDQRAIHEIDTIDGSLLRSFAYESSSTSMLRSLVYARPSGLPTLFTSGGHAIDAVTGVHLNSDGVADAQFGGGRLAIPSDSRAIYTHNSGISPSTLSRFTISRPALQNGALRVHHHGSVMPGSNGRDVAVSPDGSRVYAASGGFYSFPVYDGASLAQLEVLDGSNYPNNAAVSWNGTFAGGADSYYGDVDLWIYSPQGEPLGTRRCSAQTYGYRNLVADSVVFSGDGMRIACASGRSDENKAVYVLDVP